jgi:hypothetical protein
LPHLGLTKAWIPVFFRVPSASIGISSYCTYGKLLAERIHVRILGHAGRILGSYLYDLCNHDIQECYRDERGLRIKFLSKALFGCFSVRNHRVAFSTSRESLPMGVKRRVYYLVFTTDDEVDFYSCIGADIFIFIGCAISAPDGSSPRGSSRIFYSSIGSEVFFFSQFFQYALQ